VKRWLYHIDAPKLRGAPCFALVVENDLVIEAPPIARWSTGKNIRAVLAWYRSKGASIQVTESGRVNAPPGVDKNKER
jgi:hypothetical protein